MSEENNENNENKKPKKKGKFRKFLGTALIILAVFVVWAMLSDDDFESEEYSYTEDDVNRELFYEQYGYYPDENDETGEYSINYGEGENSEYEASEDTITGDKNASADWTVMVYLCGSDLESKSSCAIMDINEMLKSKHGDNVNLIIQTGGSKKWHGYNISSKALQRWKIADGKITKVDEVKNASMGDPKTLTDFIKWTAKKYPAKKYALEFWNHGSGSVFGVCFDENYEGDWGSDSLFLYEVKEALDKANVFFDTFLFDCCLSATIEMGEILSKHGNYLIASEEVLYGGCFGYDTWINEMSKHPEYSGADIGKIIGPIYKSKMNEIGMGSEYTMSCIDLRKIGDVRDAFSVMASKMDRATTDVTAFNTLQKVGARAQRYGSASEQEGYTNLIDLGDFANKAKPAVPDEAEALKAAIRKSIVWEGHGSSKSGSSGIAVYYPISYWGDTDEYAKCTDNNQYLIYLSTILGDQWNAPSSVAQASRARAYTPVKKEDHKVDFNAWVDDLGEDGFYYALKFNSGEDVVSQINFELLMYDEEAGETYYLGTDSNYWYNEEKGTYNDNFQGTWMCIDDCFVYAEIIEQADDYFIYTIPIVLNGKETNLRAKYDFNEEAYTILGCMDSLSGGASAKGLRKLKKGDKIQLIYPIMSDDEDEYTEYIMEDVITWTGENEMYDGDLPEGYYYFAFNIVDMFGNDEYYTDYICMYYDGEEISICEDEPEAGN